MKKFLQKIVPAFLFVFGMGTTLNAQYCNATYSSLCSSGDYINGFQLNTISNMGTGCPGTVNNYSDFTSISTDLNALTNYTATATSGPDWGQSHAVFIDLNQDGDFNDPGEFFNLGYAGPGASISATINIPATAYPGPTRMRVICRFGTTNITSTGACGAYTWGEVEDYTVNIINDACMPVISLTSTNITSISVDINWALVDATQTDWIIEYGPTGFTVGSGTTVPVTSFPHTLSGLNPETGYQIYVYADCGGGDISPSAGPISFTTLPLCPVPTSPNSTVGVFDATLGWTAGGLETTWDVEWGNSGFVLGSGTQDFGLMAPSDFLDPLTANTPYHWYVRAVCDADLTDGVDTVSFWVGPLSFNTQPSCPAPTAFNVVTNTSGFDADISWTGGSETNWNIQWGEAGFTFGTGTTDAVSTTPSTNLSGLMPNTTYSVYLQANCGAGDESVWVGPFNFTTPIVCPQPVSLGISGLTATSINANWSSAGAESEWEVQYGLNGFTPGTGTMITGIATLTTPITGLTPSTNYCFYVRAVCGPGNTSNWAGPFCFTTIASCASPSTLGVMNVTNTAANLIWQAGGSETEWNIEWGLPGFMVDNGEEVGSVNGTNDNPYYVTGLNPSATYWYYVQAVCGASDESLWAGPFQFNTLLTNDQPCNAIALTMNAPMVQHTNVGATFDAGEGITTPTIGGTCVSQNSWCNAGSNTTTWFKFTAPAGGGAEISTFSETLTSNYTNIAVYQANECAVYTSYTLIGANTLDPNAFGPPFGSTLLLCSLTPGQEYLVKVDGLNFSGGTLFGIRVNSVNTAVNAGTATPDNVCFDGTPYDLSNMVTGSTSTNGTWYFPNEASATFSVNGLASNVNFPEAGTYTFDYVIMNACGTSSTSTSVTFVDGPSAGEDATYTTCNTFDIFLFQHINGFPQGGGTWSDDDNTGKLLNGIFKPLGLTPGDYTFTYTVAGDGTCPAATATVTITLTDCMGLEDNTNSTLSVYPNPVVDVLTIANLAITGNAEIRVLDIQGKVVFNQNVSDLNGNHLVDMSDLERGVYVIEIITENSSEKIRVIKQ